MFKLNLFKNKPDLINILSDLRTRALRKGLWFASLSFEDRVLAGLLNRHVKIVKNATLATVIARIMGKLIYAMRNWFVCKIEELGRPIAEARGEWLVSIGAPYGSEWKKDQRYIRYLGLTTLYSPVSKFLTENCGKYQ